MNRPVYKWTYRLDNLKHIVGSSNHHLLLKVII